jgi:hypothetical protein
VARSSEQHGEPSEQATRYNRETVRAAEPQRPGRIAAVVVPNTRAISRTIIYLVARGSGGRRCRCRRGRCRVGARRVLGAAGVLLTAVRGAHVVAAAVLDALGAPLRAHVVRERQSVL